MKTGEAIECLRGFQRKSRDAVHNWTWVNAVVSSKDIDHILEVVTWLLTEASEHDKAEILTGIGSGEQIDSGRSY